MLIHSHTRPDGAMVVLREALRHEGLGWMVEVYATDPALSYSNRETVLARAEHDYERQCLAGRRAAPDLLAHARATLAAAPATVRAALAVGRNTYRMRSWGRLRATVLRVAFERAAGDDAIPAVAAWERCS